MKWSCDKAAAPLLKLIFPWKSGRTYINKMLKKQLPLFQKGLKKVAAPLQKQIFKKRPPLVLPFTKGKGQSGFRYLKAICDWRGCFGSVISMSNSAMRSIMPSAFQSACCVNRCVSLSLSQSRWCLLKSPAQTIWFMLSISMRLESPIGQLHS